MVVGRKKKSKGGVSCCGSAVAALDCVLAKAATVGNCCIDTTTTTTTTAMNRPRLEDAQQYFVQRMLLPYKERLTNATDKMVELPHVLYEAQYDLMRRIVTKKASDVMSDGGVIAILGGIQINTPEGYWDYFMPLSFGLYNNKGGLLKSLWNLKA